MADVSIKDKGKEAPSSVANPVHNACRVKHRNEGCRSTGRLPFFR